MKHYFGVIVRSTACVAVLVNTLSCASDAGSVLAPVDPSPTQSSSASPPDTIYNRYIVLFRDDVSNPAELTKQMVALHGGYAFHVYQKAVKGFAVANLPPAALEALRRAPFVRLVEPDGLGEEHDAQALPLDNGSYQFSSLWSLDRLDERQAGFDGVFNYTPGTGSHIYILDTGIRCGHNQFTGRIGVGSTHLANSMGASPCIDQDGHGTEVASVAAGSTYGVAKGAIIHSVRINDNEEAYYSDMIAGLDWIAVNAIHPAVANLSYAANDFGVRDAMEGVVNSGVVMVKSAGNTNVDAFQDRGNRAYGALIVSATNQFGARAEFDSGLAAYGPTVTLWAPGYELRAASNATDVAYETVYGTSFSAPYTAGVAASFLQTEPNANPIRVRDVLRESATQNVLTNLGTGSPNRLLFSLFHSAIIQGPTDIVSDFDQTYTWTVATSGTPAFSYQWEISLNGGPFSVVSNSDSYSRLINQYDSFTFVLRLTASENAGTIVNELPVTVTAPESCVPTPPAVQC